MKRWLVCLAVLVLGLAVVPSASAHRLDRAPAWSVNEALNRRDPFQALSTFACHRLNGHRVDCITLEDRRRCQDVTSVVLNGRRLEAFVHSPCRVTRPPFTRRRLIRRHYGENHEDAPVADLEDAAPFPMRTPYGVPNWLHRWGVRAQPRLTG